MQCITKFIRDMDLIFSKLIQSKEIRYWAFLTEIKLIFVSYSILKIKFLISKCLNKDKFNQSPK